MLTLRETAAELRLGSTKTWQLAATGALPTVRLGRRVLVRRQDLDRFIEAHLEGGNESAARAGTPAAVGARASGRRARV